MTANTATPAKFRHLSSAMGRVKTLLVQGQDLTLTVSFDTRRQVWAAEDRRDKKVRPSQRQSLFVSKSYDEAVDFAVEYVEGLRAL